MKNRVTVLVDYKSGIRKKVQYMVEDATDLCKQFKKHHNLKLIESAGILYMWQTQDGLPDEFNNFVKNNINK